MKEDSNKRKGNMKINRLETHDRLLFFKKDQEANIYQGLEDCLKKNPLSLALQDRSHYVYIFAHPRTADDGVTKRMLWQPRLGKPKPQSNSYLFRAKSHSDILEICWIIPSRELWGQYKKGNVTEHEWVNWSIDQFINHPEDLAKPFEDDFSEERIKQIYREIAIDMEGEHRMKKLEIQETTSGK